MQTADKILLAMAIGGTADRWKLVNELWTALDMQGLASSHSLESAIGLLGAAYARKNLLDANVKPKEWVHNPAHYGGADNKYEVIKLIDDWGLGFCYGNALKYILRAQHKGTEQLDLNKTLWYLKHGFEIEETPALSAPYTLSDVEACSHWKLSTQLTSCVMEFATSDNVDDAIETLQHVINERWPIVGASNK